MEASLGSKCAIGIYYVIIATVGALGNIALLYAILVNKRSRTMLANIHLITLAISDLLTCVLVVPFLLISLDLPEYDESHEDKYLIPCRVAIYIVYCCGVKRILALTVMSVDRYIAIVHPFFYDKHFRPSSALIVNIIISLQGIATNLPMPLMPGWVAYEGRLGSPCGFIWKGKYAYLIIYLLFNFAFPSIILITTNVRVFLVARKQRNRIMAFQQRSAIFNCSKNLFGMPSVEDGQSTSTPQMERRDSPGQASVTSTPLLTNKLHHASITSLPVVADSLRHESIATSPAIIMKQTRVAELKTDSIFTVGNTSKTSNNSAADKASTLPRTVTNISFIDDRTPSLPRKKLRLAFGENKNKEPNAFSDCVLSQMKSIRRRAYIQDITIFFSTLILVLVFLVTYFPFAFSRLLIVVDRKYFSWTVVAVTSSLTILSAGVNSIIVIGTRSDLRKTIKAKLLRMFHIRKRHR